MKSILSYIAALLCTTTAMAATKTVTVTVTNPSAFERKAVPVVMEVNDDVRSATVRLDGREIPCQLDDLDDDGEFDELAFLTDMKKKEKQVFRVELSTTDEPRQYDNITYGYIGIRDRDKTAKKLKHQEIKSVTFPKETNPYNYIFPHGAVMENDMVGFRVYCDHRQSIDYYGHRTLKADIAETGFYPSKEQKEAGSGDDVLYTGSTYGCGALHGWNGKTAVMFENVRNRTQTVVTDGPVRCILDISNKGWRPVEGRKPVDITTRYILYAGHRDVEVQVDFSRDVADIPLSTGIVDIVEGSEEFTDKAGLRGCWGTACAGNNPKVYDIHTVGLGISVPKKYYKADSHFTDGKERLPNQAYVQVAGTDSDKLNYWFTVTCDMESFGFKDSKEWFAYLKEWKRQLDTPVIIKRSND
ncbi:MAG: DUF4861 domain-containing protein [Prevotellaceae bacterium]|nr:DUF4861 domain-containing protein [Prevotellaceae bacterium]MDO4931526.1 DUF4861 domain-containing protein [Prevotellaceae bacterium]